MKLLAILLCAFSMANAYGASSIEELERKVNLLADELTKIRAGQTHDRVQKPVFGLGASASKVYQVGKGLSIGGYGEIVYKNTRSETESGSKTSGGATVDALRNILYVGYKFTDRWVLNTEIEIEHADEIFAEFITLDYLFKDALNFRAGLLLAPVGFVNELHEPTTFFSVNRPEIESKIIPTTWRENGVGIFGKTENLQYRFYLMNGLDGAKFSSDGVRSGRKKGSQANARDWAWVGRLDWSGIKGLTLGGSVYVGDANSASDIGHNILEGHAEYLWKGLKTRFLYVISRIDGAAALNNELGLTGNAGVGKKLEGFYAEAGYNVLHGRSSTEVIPFVRYEKYDTQDGIVTGFQADDSKDRTNLTFGTMIRPIERISFKLDYTVAKNKAETGQDSWNLGMGWNF